MAKEIRAFWDVNTLTEYVSLKQIPRGLRIKKFPTFELTDDILKSEWTDALSNCSFQLMKIIVDFRQKDLDHLQGEMVNVQKELAELQHMTLYAELDSQLTKRMDKLEREVIANKKDKKNRDQFDYDTGKVFSWKKKTLPPELSKEDSL